MVTMTNEVESWGSPHYKFYGLAKDTKPTENVPENSEFRELDTGADFYYSEGSWHPSPASSDGGSSSAGAEPFIVTITVGANDEYVGDKTYKEVYDAFSAYQPCYLVANVPGVDFKGSVSAVSLENTEYRVIGCFGDSSLAVIQGAADDYLSFT